MSTTYLKTNADVSLHFQALPEYCLFLLNTRLEEFTEIVLRTSIEIEVPLLSHFKSMSSEELFEVGKKTNSILLLMLSKNQIAEYIEQSCENWLQNQLPVVQRDHVIAEDVTMINFARKKAFRTFLKFYSPDLDVFNRIMEEIDRFVMLSESTFFNAYVSVQQEKFQRVNEDLQQREAQLLEAQEIAHIGSFDWDLSEKNSSYTPELFNIFERGQITNLESFLHDVHPEDRLKVRTAIDTALETGLFECEYRYIRNSKEKMIWTRGVAVMENGKLSRMRGTVMDTTARHRIIQQLQQSEQLHKQAQAITHLGNWTLHFTKNILIWSDETFRIFGLEPQSEEITLEKFLSFIHSDDRESMKQLLNNPLEKFPGNEYHFRINSRDKQNKIIRIRGDVVTDPDNNPLRIVGTCQDVTKESLLNAALKTREEYTASLNRRLEQKNRQLIRKNRELESFNFVASHDLQEPLRKIQLYASRIQERKDQIPEDTLQYFEKIMSASGRMQQLIDDFLSFSQTIASSLNYEKTDLNGILEEVKAELNDVIEEKKALIESSPLPTIEAVPYQIKQLLINLLGNSIKYSKQNVPPVVRITGATVAGSRLPEEWVTPEKNYLKLTIADNGIGFEQKYAARIFELFQRLHGKDQYSGTGIGLSICKKVVENHNGSISAFGEPGLGAVFNIYLPLKQ